MRIDGRASARGGAQALGIRDDGKHAPGESPARRGGLAGRAPVEHGVGRVRGPAVRAGVPDAHRAAPTSRLNSPISSSMRERLLLHPAPRARVVPLGVEVLDAPALLLDPGVVLQVVDAPALALGQLQHVVGGLAGERNRVRACRGLPVERSLGLLQLPEARAVEVERVGEDRQHHVVLREVVVPGELDRGEQVADARDAEQGQRPDRVLGHALRGEHGLPRGLVEQAQQGHAVRVVHRDHGVRIPARCGSRARACRRCPRCGARRSRSRAASGTGGPRPRRSSPRGGPASGGHPRPACPPTPWRSRTRPGARAARAAARAPPASRRPVTS